MAKIGNEAKLILKLAKGRMTTEYEMRVHNYEDDREPWLAGFATAVNVYETILDTIIEELEAR